MQHMKLKELPAMGAGISEWQLVGIDQFITHYSPGLATYVSACKQFPPLHILNEELLTGGRDKGMSGGSLWKPFTLSQADYQDLFNAMVGNSRYGLEYDSRLEDRKTLKKWCGAVISFHNPRNQIR